jgi:DNA-binding transcriptional MocR family regulator
MEAHKVVVLVGEAASSDPAATTRQQYFRISYNLDDLAWTAEGVKRLGSMLRALR